MRTVDLRKGVHIKLMPQTHTEFRIFALQHRVSMQESIEEFAQLLVDGDRRALSIIEDLKDKKRNREIEKLTEKDTEDVYDMIELEDPLKD